MTFLHFPPIQPTGLWQYLSTHKLSIPSDVQRYFYASWEDALWDVLLHFNVKNGAKILLPTFFCMDVVENIKTHGLKPVWYEVDRNFQSDPREFKKSIERENPAIVVILHAVGITNTLFSQNEKWLNALPKESILIEDSVHRIVDPAKIQLIHEKHLVIDSLRKVVPLAGSNLYGIKSILNNLRQTSVFATIPYQLRVFGWWMIFQLCLKLGKNQWAEKAMLKGYDEIGDSYQAGRGWWIFGWLAMYLDIAHIENVKTNQVKQYKSFLKSLWISGQFFEIAIPESDFGKLRGFPVGIEINNAEEILSKMRRQECIIRFELNDSIWSQKQKVIYLLLGPHVTKEQIMNVCSLLKSV